MADPERVRLEIAFRGGQTLSVDVPTSTAEDLDRALANGSSESLSFDAEDGLYTVAVRSIVFVKRHARESRVGFGAGG
jgi:hypothetical protein